MDEDWIYHDGKGVPDEVLHRLVEVEYVRGSPIREEFYVDPSTWTEYGSAWQWGTWTTQIRKYRFKDTPEFMMVEDKEELPEETNV